ncbi:hypothetical protein COOONC_19513 [Cooperia oncophora]
MQEYSKTSVTVTVRESTSSIVEACKRNTIDESSIVAGCGMHESVHALPIPAARMFHKNEDGEVDLSSDEYGAHTFQKKTTTDTIKDKDGQVDMSSDEYGAHTFLKKRQAHHQSVRQRRR